MPDDNLTAEKKCPRCGTEGCPAEQDWAIDAADNNGMAMGRIQADIACSLRALIDRIGQIGPILAAMEGKMEVKL